MMQNKVNNFTRSHRLCLAARLVIIVFFAFATATAFGRECVLFNSIVVNELAAAKPIHIELKAGTGTIQIYRCSIIIPVKHAVIVFVPQSETFKPLGITGPSR